MKNIKESLADNEIIGLVIPDVDYREKMVETAGILSKKYNKVLYISVNKPYEKLISEFKQDKINTDKFHFIDCITKTVKDTPSTKNCTYVSSPKALDEIQTTILDVLKEQRIDVALVDSPSSLTIYYEHMGVLQFMHRLITSLIIARCKGIFPFQKEGAGPVRRSIEMFTDKVAYLDPSRPSRGGYLNKNPTASGLSYLLKRRMLNLQYNLASKEH